MGTQNVYYEVCQLKCVVEETNPGGVFSRFISVCPAHVAIVALNPLVASFVIRTEAQNFSWARQAVIDTELSKQWSGETQAKVDAAIDQKLEDEEILQVLDLADTEPSLLDKRERVLELERSPYVISGTAPNRIGVFTVIKPLATKAEHDTAIALKLGHTDVTVSG